MIFGVGTDVVSVERISDVLLRQDNRFLARVLAFEERSEMPASAEASIRFLARRWAAKEAFAKAFGTGIRGVVALNAISIRHDEFGKPIFSYSEQLAKTMIERRLIAHLSISDEREYAVAFVVIEQQVAP